MTAGAQLAAALALVIAFALPWQLPRMSAVWLCSLQSALTSASASLSAWVEGDIALGTFAVIAFTLNGLVLPLTLRRIMPRANRYDSTEGERSKLVFTLFGIALVAVCIAATMRLGLGAQRDAWALGLSILLLGLMQASRRPALGLLSAQNGLVLAAAAIPGRPLLVLLIVAIPLVPALVTFSVYTQPPNPFGVARI